jgi:endonuclease III
LMSIHGVGPGIANMTLLLIERMYKTSFADLDHTKMDIKPDVHTVRVLYRLGVSSGLGEQAAIDAARQLNPSYPGAVDAALWIIGRKWCHPIYPNCKSCYMNPCCGHGL